MLISSDLETKNIGLVCQICLNKRKCLSCSEVVRQVALWEGRESVKDRIKITEGLECRTKAFDKEEPLDEGDPVCILES